MHKNLQSTYNILLCYLGETNNTVLRVLNIKLQHSIVTCEEISVRRYNTKYHKYISSIFSKTLQIYWSMWTF